MTRTCRTCNITKPVTDYAESALAQSRPECRDCYRIRRASRQGAAPRAPKATVAKSARVGRADFVLSREVESTWAAVQMIAKDGDIAPNMLFTGPSGSGKTEAARELARLAGLPFTKVDAPSMTDPEAWFGTREVVVESGAPKTIYRPSAFVEAIQRPGVLVVDEVNRVADAVRGILLALLDDSRACTNPLTGETVVRHPACFVIMTGNVGLAFTGTYAVDPAFLTRSLTTRFEYITDPAAEARIAVERTGCSQAQADLFVRFATETRSRSKQDEDFPPISTREVLTACKLAARGLDETTAARQAVINAASDEGGADSLRAALEMIWTGIRPTLAASRSEA